MRNPVIKRLSFFFLANGGKCHLQSSLLMYSKTHFSKECGPRLTSTLFVSIINSDSDFDLILYIPINNFSVMLGRVFLG